MQEFVTHSREETVAVGCELAKTLPAGALIAFTGGLGAGKTAFCQGLAEGLGCTDPVSSPTFAIVNYYRGPRPFAHFDLYRIHTEGDLAAAGGVPDVDRIVQIQMLHHRRDVRRVMVHIVPLANLIGAAMTPTIDSDDPEPFGKEK